MSYTGIAISSGHGKYVRGAAGILDEVDEARRLVADLIDALRYRKVGVAQFHDDVSTSQNENLNRITDWHNEQIRDLDISVHFNAYEQCEKPMGVEVLYVTQAALAEDVSGAIAWSGQFIDRGPKKRTDLHFLNKTDKPSILIETCFVDSEADADLYRNNYTAIVDGIADLLAGDALDRPDAPAKPGTVGPQLIGKCSWFGGPEDTGVSPSEGLAFISSVDQAQHLFLPNQPKGTSGLARRLNPYVHFIACRWDYDNTSKTELLDRKVWVKSLASGVRLQAFPADWGPNENTGRVADLSKGLLDDLGLTTDDEVMVTWVEDD